MKTYGKLTFELIKEDLKRGGYISTVKNIKDITGLSLKESSEEIDNNCLASDISDRDSYGCAILDYEKSVKYFSKYFFEDDASKIESALVLTLANWSALGYKSPKDACLAILNNF